MEHCQLPSQVIYMTWWKEHHSQQNGQRCEGALPLSPSKVSSNILGDWEELPSVIFNQLSGQILRRVLATAWIGAHSDVCNTSISDRKRLCPSMSATWSIRSAQVFAELPPDPWSIFFLPLVLMQVGNVITLYCMFITLFNPLLDEMHGEGLVPDTSIYMRLISDLCFIENLPMAMEIFKEMKSMGVPHSVVTYNFVLSAHCRAGHLKEAEALLAQMRGEGLVPDEFTYAALILGHCRFENLPKVLEIFEEMKSKGVPPTILTYNCLLVGQSLAGHLEEAEALLAQMRGEGLVPDAITYTALISNHCRCENLPKALEILEEMKSKGVPPRVMTYNSLLSAHCRAGHLEEAEALLAQMLGEGLVPDEDTYTELIAGHCRCQNLPKAHKIFEEMERVGVELDSSNFYRLLNLMASEGKMQEAGYLYCEMLKRLTPDKRTYGVFSTGYRKIGDHMLVTYLEVMIERGISEEGSEPQ